jgi:Raf kinase inhibitor-like YbhB/YbcL family protein
MHLRSCQFLFFSAAVSLAAINAACSKSEKAVLPEDRSTPMIIKITSSSFAEGQPIPSKYTCDGENISPPLSWDKAPDSVESFALVCDDPDAPAGTWVHWVLYDLPATIRDLPEATETKEEVLNGGRQGRNDFKQIGYGGPCPPKGRPHRYYFKLYALDRELNLKSGATKGEVENAMKGHILAEGALMGTYKRK